MKTKEKFMMYVKLAQRAEGMGIYTGERFTLLMDIENADKVFNLRLEDLLNADDFDFVHDIISFMPSIGFSVCGLDYSPITGPEGNVEFLLYMKNSVCLIIPLGPLKRDISLKSSTICSTV